MSIATLERPPEIAPNPETKEETSPPSHQIGVAKRYQMDQKILAMAKLLGAKIIHRPDGEFTLHFVHGDGALDEVVSSRQIKERINFLYRPVLTTLQTVTKADGKKYKKEEMHDLRVQALSIFRQVGPEASPTIPPYRLEYLEEELHACHANQEQGVKEDGMWSRAEEIDLRGRIEAHQKHLQDMENEGPKEQSLAVLFGNWFFSRNQQARPLESSIIPGSAFDPNKGFGFALKKPLYDMAEGDHPDTAGGRIDGWFAAQIDQITGGRYREDNPDYIHLTPGEMELLTARIYTAIEHKDLRQEITKAQKEERANTIIERIEGKIAERSVQDISDEVLGAYSKNAKQGEAQKRLKLLALASTALTPFLCSETLKQYWRDYFYSQRKTSPMEEIQKDLEDVQAAMEHFAKDGNLSPEAFEQFLSDPVVQNIVGFAAAHFEILEGGLKKAKTADDIKLKNQYATLKDLFENASYSGQAMAPGDLPEHYQKVLEAEEIATAQGDGAYVRLGKSFVENGLDFAGDLIKTPFLKPIYTLPFAAMVAFLLWRMNGGDPASAEEAAKAAAAAANASSDTQFDTSGALPGFEDMMANEDAFADIAAPEARGEEIVRGQEGIDWHKHPAPWTERGWVPHYVMELVSGTTKTALALSDAIFQTTVKWLGMPGNPNSTFMNAALEAANTGAVVSDLLNYIQNYAGHIYYFASMTLTGAIAGLPGGKRLIGFWNDFHDAARTIAREKPLAMTFAMAGFGYDKFFTHGGPYDFAKGAIGIPVAGVALYALSQVIPKMRKDPGYLVWAAGALLASGFVFDYIRTNFMQVSQTGDIKTGFFWMLAGGVAGHIVSKILPSKHKKNPPKFSRDMSQNAQAIMDEVCREAEAKNREQDLNDAMAEAAFHFTELEKELPSQVREAHIRLKYEKGAHTTLGKAANFVKNRAASLNLRNKGLNKEFNINAQNFKPIMTALYQLDIALNYFGEQMHIESDEHRRFVQTAVNTVKEAMISFQTGDIDEEELRLILKDNLRDVMAAQAALSESADIYEAFMVHEVRAKDMLRFKNHGDHMKGRHDRRDRFHEFSREAEEAVLRRSPNPTCSVPGYLEKWRYGTVSYGQAHLNTMWDVMVNGMRGLQSTYINTSRAVKTAAISALAVGLGTSAVEMAGYHTDDETVQKIAKISGVTVSYSATAGVFLIVNTGDDQIVVHFGLGGMCFLGGAAVYYTREIGLKPGLEWLKDLIRKDEDYAPSYS